MRCKGVFHIDQISFVSKAGKQITASRARDAEGGIELTSFSPSPVFNTLSVFTGFVKMEFDLVADRNNLRISRIHEIESFEI